MGLSRLARLARLGEGGGRAGGETSGIAETAWAMEARQNWGGGDYEGGVLSDSQQIDTNCYHPH